MSKKEEQEYLVKHHPGKEVKFLGSGTDSNAFRVDNFVYRFPHNKAVAVQYEREAAICDYIRPSLSVEVPKIEVCSESGLVYAKHKMIMGRAWDWWMFALHPIKQRNLADGLAQFFAQLHGCDLSASFRKRICADNFEYINLNDILPQISPFLSKWQLRFLTKKINKALNASVPESDMVLCHMGIKGCNSVVDENGNLIGVFDFGNAGIHERWRDFVLLFNGQNTHLYKMVLRRYSKYTGIKYNCHRIRELAGIERFIYKRWFNQDGTIAPMPAYRVKRYLSHVMVFFMHLPPWTRTLIRMEMTIRAYFHKSGK